MGTQWQRPLTLGTTLRKGRRAQAQIGNRWGHRARPETPDPQGGVGGKEGEREGRPLPGSQSRPCCCPRAGLKTPGLRRERGRPLGFWELGEAFGEGRRP